jgi:Peptidase_C39 like family
MIVLLLVLLAVALIVTIAGYFLTIRTSTSRIPAQTSSTVYARNGRNQEFVYSPRRRASREQYVIQQRRVPRYAIVTEASPGLIGLFPTMVGRIRGWRMGDPLPLPVAISGLVVIFLVGLYVLVTVLPQRALIGLVTFSGDPPAQTAPGQSNAPLPLLGASKALERLGQLDHGQYNSTQEYNLWAYSACSAAAMTEVMNAYGHHYRITDILQVEARIHEITPQLGLLEDVGIQRTAAQFGFKTNWGHNPSLNDIIAIANSGRPVIVSFPPDRYAGGHLLVVIGGNSSYVYLADSSIWNRKALTHAQFLHWWEGFYAVMTPN